MLKYWKRIRRKLISESNIKKYLLYAIGEIFLVMIGILLALQVNNWNESQKIKDSKLHFYKNIERQLIEDKGMLLGNMAFNEQLISQSEYASEIILNRDLSKIDTLKKISLNLLQFSDVHRKSNIYETISNSGELKLLDNPELIAFLQRMEENYIYINRLEESHWEVINLHVLPAILTMTNLNSEDLENVDTIFGIRHSNTFILLRGLMEEKNQKYKLAIDETDVLLNLIRQEID